MPKAFGIVGVPKRGGSLKDLPHNAIIDGQTVLGRGCIQFLSPLSATQIRNYATGNNLSITTNPVFRMVGGERCLFMDTGKSFDVSDNIYRLKGSTKLTLYVSAASGSVEASKIAVALHTGSVASSGYLVYMSPYSAGLKCYRDGGLIYYYDGPNANTGLHGFALSSNTGRHSLFVDGRLIGSSTASVDTIKASNLSIGSWYSGDSYSYGGDLAIAGLWDREITEEESLLLWLRPNSALWIPKKRVFFVPTGGGQALTKSVSDALTLGESTARSTTFTRSSTDALTVGESTVRAATFNRSQSNALSLGESTTRAATFNRSASNALTLGESTARAATFNRTGSDALTLGETLAKVATLFRSSADALTVGEATTRATTFTRSSTDALALGESTTRQLNPGGNALTQSVSDGLTLGESTSRVTTYTRSTSDALTVGESTVTLRCRYVSKADALTLGETSARVTTYTRTSNDTITIGDVSARVATLFRSRSDAITLGDAASGAATLRRSNADALTVGESASPVRGRIASAADALSLDDAEGSELLIGTGDPTAPYICLSPYRISRSPALQHQAVKGQYDPRLKSRPVS
jgi:hypothetical protein